MKRIFRFFIPGAVGLLCAVAATMAGSAAAASSADTVAAPPKLATGGAAILPEQAIAKPDIQLAQGRNSEFRHTYRRSRHWHRRPNYDLRQHAPRHWRRLPRRHWRYPPPRHWRRLSPPPYWVYPVPVPGWYYDDDEPPYCNYRACARAYRSFRARDCTYQPYHGPRRYCTK